MESMAAINTFWKGRRVFVTGHTGFKGGWLCLWLNLLGARIHGYALDPPTQPNLYEAIRIADLIEVERGDINDYSNLKNALISFAPEVIFHMAAQPIVRLSYQEPIGTYATNIMGTAHILDAARYCPSVQAIVCVTSDKCYENREWSWAYRENDRLGGHDPYSSSKACAELICAAYRDSFFPIAQMERHKVGLATARAGNVIGGGDWAKDRLIPDLLKGFAAGKCVPIRNPHAIRPWQHVLEPLRGYLLLAERLINEPASYSSAWNFGPRTSDARSVEWIAKKLSHLWGSEAAWEIVLSENMPEAQFLHLDHSLATQKLNWQPVLNIEEALQWTIIWHQAWKEGVHMHSFSTQQIYNYLSKIDVNENMQLQAMQNI